MGSPTQGIGYRRVPALPACRVGVPENAEAPWLGARRRGPFYR